MKTAHRFVAAMLALSLVLGAAASVLLLATPGALAAAATTGSPGVDSEVWRWGLMAAAIATSLAALGAGFAVARVGAAAIGALAEKPELFGRLLIFVGLAEGIAIYGLIVSILILNRLVA
jgi:V/A-type H+-transporting ATPase subunit K